MISQIIIGIGLLLLLIILRIFYKSLRLYIIYKRRYGDQVKFLIYPVVGLIHYFNISLQKHDDSYYFLKQILRENPKLKAIIILSGFMDMLIACDNEWIKFLSQDSRQFFKDDAFFCYDAMLGQGIGFSHNKKWKRQRLFLNGSFHFDAIKSYVPIFKEAPKIFCSEIKPEDGFVKINSFERTRQITGEIISRTFFGHSFKDIYCQNGTAISQEICQLVSDGYVYRISSLYFIIKAALLGNTRASYFLNNPSEKKLLARMNDVSDIIEKEIDKKISEINSRKEDLLSFQPTNFIEIYLKEYLLQQKNLSNIDEDDLISKKEIIQQYETFFFAGTDTTSQLISMCLLELARNNQIKEKLDKEIQENVKSFDLLQQSDFAKFSYLDAVIKETNRLYSVQSFLVPRRAFKTYQREDLFIDKEMLSTFRLIQYSEEQEFLKDSDKFIPERYLNQQNLSKMNSFDVIPFSAGERNCIGQHMAMIEARFLLIYILMNFEIALVPNYKLRMFQFMLNQPTDLEYLLIKKK